MKGDILQQYTEARINERLHLFLQFPDLRRSFQEIDRKDLAFQRTATSSLPTSPFSCCNSQFRPDGDEAARKDQAAADKMLRPEGLSQQNHP